MKIKYNIEKSYTFFEDEVRYFESEKEALSAVNVEVGTVALAESDDGAYIARFVEDNGKYIKIPHKDVTTVVSEDVFEKDGVTLLKEGETVITRIEFNGPKVRNPETAPYGDHLPEIDPTYLFNDERENKFIRGVWGEVQNHPDWKNKTISQAHESYGFSPPVRGVKVTHLIDLGNTSGSEKEILIDKSSLPEGLNRAKYLNVVVNGSGKADGDEYIEVNGDRRIGLDKYQFREITDTTITIKHLTGSVDNSNPNENYTLTIHN